MRLTRRTGIGPVSAYKREQAGISRRKLYRVTVFYTACSVVLIVLGMRSGHPYQAVVYYLLGLPLWTFTEYSSHRWVFHKRFKMSQRKFKKYLTYFSHKFLDETHVGHHERPSDGDHINGRLRDLMPIFLVTLPGSFLFPVYTAPMLLAGVIQFYVLEEWIHHCMHYYNFKNPYFRHIKKSHLYHHSSQGFTHGFGITNAFWDVVFRTQYPLHVRARLFGRAGYAQFRQRSDPTLALPNNQELQ